MTNGYPIFEWAPGVPILDNYEYENEISNAMEQLSYDMDADPYDEDDEDDKDDEGRGEYGKSDGHDDGDDNKDPD